MVIGNLNLVRSVRFPDETDPVLVIDSYAVLSLSVSTERLESVGRRDAKIVQVDGCLNLVKLTQSHSSDGCPALTRARFKEQPRIAVFEALNHMFSI